MKKIESGKKNKFWFKKAVVVMLCALVSVLYYAGCGAMSESADNMMFSSSVSSAPEYSSDGYYDSAMGGAIYEKGEIIETTTSKAEASVESAVFDERKLIKTVNMDVETKEFEQMMSTLEKQIRDMGGYIENMETYNGSSYSNYRSSRYASLTIRIPKAKLDEFLLTVSDIGNVVRRSDNVEDVTLSYVDMESRRDALRTEQDRLLELLEQAGSIEDIITIEDRLSTVRYQLESMESQLRTLDNQVEYSTVNLDVSEVQELTPVVEKNAFERIAEGFVESLRDIGDDAVEAFIWFVVNIPYFVIWAVVIVICVVLLKIFLKKKKQKKAAQQN